MRSIQDITKMTWKEIESLSKEKTILFLTFAPIEEHGIHMPLGVDLILGEKWKELAMQLFYEKNKDYTMLTMPPIPFAQGSVKGFPGNLYVRQRTVFRVAYELLNSIANWGIKNIIIIASHGEPKHLVAIEQACKKINQKHGICAISPMGAFFSYNELGIDLNFDDEIKKYIDKYPNDFHAGWIETSAILDINKSFVKSEYANLPDTHVEEKEMIFPNKVSRKIANYGHIGFPRIAQKEIGTLLNRNTAEYISDVTTAFVLRKGYEKYQHHFLYKMPFMRVHFMRNLLILLMITTSALFIFLILKLMI